MFFRSQTYYKLKNKVMPNNINFMYDMMSFKLVDQKSGIKCQF